MSLTRSFIGTDLACFASVWVNGISHYRGKNEQVSDNISSMSRRRTNSSCFSSSSNTISRIILKAMSGTFGLLRV